MSFANLGIKKIEKRKGNISDYSRGDKSDCKINPKYSYKILRTLSECALGCVCVCLCICVGVYNSDYTFSP